MKKHLLSILTLLTLVTLMFTGCAKAEKEPEEPTPTTTGSTPEPEFRWTPSGGSLVVTNNAYFIPAYNNIVALRNGTSASVDIVLDNLDEGNHVISSTSGITLEYNDGTTTHTGKSGSVNITESGATLSGNFTCTFSGGSVSSISGSFTDIPQK